MYLTRSFPYRTLLIRVKREAQDISIYMLMRGGQVMSAPSAYPLQLPPRQLHIPSIYYSHLIQMVVVFRVQSSALRWNRRPSLYHGLAVNAQARLTSSLGPSPQPNMDDFIKTTELSLSSAYSILMEIGILRWRRSVHHR